MSTYKINIFVPLMGEVSRANTCSSIVIGMDNNTRFSTYTQALTQYIEREGNSQIPAAHVEKIQENHISLGAWVGYIRQRYRKNQLSEDRVKKIQEIPNWQWGPFKPGPATDISRNSEIHQMRAAGKSLREIADVFDLSRQRVHQIIRKNEDV
jgi:DNA-binding NarL/FixJ family response regulator